jgi:hypothetical protein
LKYHAVCVASSVQFTLPFIINTSIMPRGSSSVQLVRRSARIRLSKGSSSRPALVRNDTRSRAAAEGQQFLDAFNFDPAQKRSVIVPRRFTIVLSAAPIRSRKNKVAQVTVSNGAKRQKAALVKKSRVSKKVSSKGSARAAPAPAKVAPSPAVPAVAPSAAKAAPFAPAFNLSPVIPPSRQVPALWKFQSSVPAFALNVTPDSGAFSVSNIEISPSFNSNIGVSLFQSFSVISLVAF